MGYNFAEIIIGGVKNRGNVVKLPENKTNLDLDYYGKESIDSFHSAFLHTEDYNTYNDQYGGKKGYNGRVFSHCLFWDIDNKDLNIAKYDTVQLVKRLEKINTDNIYIYFSGNKGFHIIYICPELEQIKNENNFNLYVEKICYFIAQNINSIDYKIYDKTRIIRTINSKHSKTNLYKIEISKNELFDLPINTILLLAKKQRQSKKIKYVKEYNGDIVKIINNINNVTTNKTIKRKTFDVNEILDGIRNGFSDGSRNTGITTIAGMLHRRNIDTEFIKCIIQAINEKGNNPLPYEEISTIVNSIGRYPVDQEYISPIEDDIVDIKQAGDAWYNLIEKSGYTSFGERFKHVNDRLRMVIPGDAIAFVANSGVGKTTCGLELGNNEAVSRGVYSLVASLEMSKAGVFFRAATIEAVSLEIDSYIPSSEVAKTLLRDTVLRDEVYKSWKNLRIVDKGGISLDKIIEYFKIAQEKYNNKIGNLVIDYAQNIKDSEKIDYSMMMARRFKEIAKELNTKLFVLMQCNKTMPDDYTEIQRTNIEGTGAYYQAMDYIISAWRSRDRKNRLHCKIMKDRWGSPEYMFDLVRKGMKYHTEDYVKDREFGGL